MPQNTQLPAEILNEDDSVIQDMLNNLNSSGTPEVSIPQQQPSQDDFIRLAAMNNMNINQMYNPYVQQAGGIAPQSFPMAQQQPLHTSSFTKQFAHIFSNEFKLAGVVFVAVIVVHFVPFHTYVSKYIAIDKIPYHDILFRAIVAALLVIVAKKMLIV
jgi:hypothetical protein